MGGPEIPCQFKTKKAMSCMSLLLHYTHVPSRIQETFMSHSFSEQGGQYGESGPVY